MDWRTLFTLQHHQVHSRALSGDGNDFHIPDALLHDMTEEQLEKATQRATKLIEKEIDADADELKREIEAAAK